MSGSRHTTTGDPPALTVSQSSQQSLWQQKLRQPSLSKLPSSSSLMAMGAKRRGSRSSLSSFFSFQSGALRDRDRTQQRQSEPSYRMEPDRKFPVGVVEGIIQSAFTEHLCNEQYEPTMCKQMSKALSEIIKARVKKLGLKRYRYVVLVHIGQLNGQGMRIASRCLWDVAVDRSATWTMKTSTLFAVGSVFGLYYE